MSTVSSNYSVPNWLIPLLSNIVLFHQITYFLAKPVLRFSLGVFEPGDECLEAHNGQTKRQPQLLDIVGKSSVLFNRSLPFASVCIGDFTEPAPVSIHLYTALP